MTYCLGIITRDGIVMAADSRTNAGVDHISRYKKLFDFSCPGERVILVCTAGNLSMTQGAINEMHKDLKAGADVNLHTLSAMSDVARYIGSKIRHMAELDGPWLKKDGIEGKCSMILGGQIKGQDPELFLIYSQGNCIQAAAETPFLQIGETKYGKPILDRVMTFEASLDAAAKCALLSIDSTMKSNISVGPPINLVMYSRDSFAIKHRLLLRLGDPYLAQMRKLWEDSLKQAFDRIPDINWQYNLETDAVEKMIID
ncbi:MAG: proteasome-type protease [Oscillatoriaceae cyanobacterium Prado104]|jgi:putative proteasome-type protease|nr:proteasome-type protease [Oscillatoriaceae cyanobacterium Prado104]